MRIDFNTRCELRTATITGVVCEGETPHLHDVEIVLRLAVGTAIVAQHSRATEEERWTR